ncbi:UNVERIFIED_CONTAM: hypothetical protein FKN15_006237 [Acipenser sinensis]
MVAATCYRQAMKDERLNNAPVSNFIEDIGNKTTIRMSYPEGSPKSWDDVDPKTLFVAVIYKTVDFNWLKAMIKRETVSLWDRLFFWQGVPKEIPIGISQFRILNPEIISQTAVDLWFLKGMWRLRPPRRTVLPEWSLDIVLEALTNALFDPIYSIKLKYLSMKTAFFGWTFSSFQNHGGGFGGGTSQQNKKDRRV